MDVGQSCKILSWNVRGVKDNGSLLISKHLKHFYFSCIQETRFKDKHQAQSFRYLIEQSFGGRVFISDKNGGQRHQSYPRSGGVATIIHGSCPTISSAELVASASIPNRYVLVRLRWGDTVCYIHNVYAPNQAAVRRRFFENLPVAFEENAVHIVCGDFNLALDPDLDANTVHPGPDSSRTALSLWLSELNVVDAWRLHHPAARVYSGPLPRVNRIDYTFLSDDLLCDCYHDSGYSPWENGGDHLAHHVELTSWHHPTGTGFWRLPGWLLEIPELKSDILDDAKAILPILRESSNPGIVWKSWKRKMKGYLKRCQRNLRSVGYSNVQTARAHLEECAAATVQTDATDQDQINYYFAKQHYKECQKEWKDFGTSRGFEQTVTMAEKSNKYFFRPTRFQLRSTPFRSIRRRDGSISTDPAEICQGFQEHWGEIFGDSRFTSASSPTTVDMDAQQQLLDSIDRTLNTAEAASLDSEFTVDEFADAIKRLKPHSAPGPDGFTSDFYRLDPVLFGEILLVVFQYQLERGILLPHQRYSSVALLFKKGEREDPGNFRPISLMPVEVKILSRVLVNRLRPLMPKLVHPDQKGFIPGRLIHEQVFLVRDLQHLLTSQRHRGIATFLDFAKAYDRVNRPYLFRVLARQGFGPRFLSWIRLLYTNAQCSLMINGWAQDALTPTRGVKQGDPLSPFLFALSLEPLGNLLRARRDLGVRVDETLSIPVGFFADDTVLFSKGKQQLMEQLSIVDCYCAGSGAMLNHHKSVIMSLNNKCAAPQLEPLRSLAKGETVKYLGIPFGNFDTSVQLAKQLESRLLARLRLWKGRARTLLGRRLVVQVEILSLLWYFTTAMIIPTRFIRRWQGIVNRYVQYNRVSVGTAGVSIVQKGLAVRPRELDGIGVPDIATVIRRQHLQQLQYFVVACSAGLTDDNVWYRPALHMIQLRYGPFMRPRSGDFLFQEPPRPAGWRPTMMPLWWRRILKDWSNLQWPNRSSLSTSRLNTVQYALFSPLWWNKSSEFCLRCTRESTRPAKLLGSGTAKFGRLCRALAEKHMDCFADFLDESRSWPSLTAFVSKICSILQSQLDSVDLADIPVLYRQLWGIFCNILPHPGAGGVHAAHRTVFPPILGVVVTSSATTSTTTRFFPNLQTDDWTKLLVRAPELLHHPLEDLGCPHRLVHLTLSRCLTLRGVLIPVVHDVLLRLYFGDLTVGSRLIFLKSFNPTIQECVRSHCRAVESVRHCFFACPSLTPMWFHLWEPWHQAFRAPLTWRLLLFPQSQDLHPRWRKDHKILLLLWRVHTAVIFHATWRLRNDILFRETPIDVPSVPGMLHSFTMHYQFIYRHAAELNYDQRDLAAVLDKLGFSPPAESEEARLERHTIWIPRA